MAARRKRKGRPVKNPFWRRKPTGKEITEAQRLARRVSPDLLALMEAETIKQDAAPASSSRL